MSQRVLIETHDGDFAAFEDPSVDDIRWRFPLGSGISLLRIKHGNYSTSIHWDRGEEPDDTNLAVALDEDRARTAFYMGEGRKTFRVLCRKPYVLFIKDVSPPIWRWPRLQLNSQRIRVGWRYTAYTLGWRGGRA